jgi:hypothetical protein
MKRRAAGKKTRAEYLAAARSKTQPWRTEGISRRTWYRHRGTSPSAINPSLSWHKSVGNLS